MAIAVGDHADAVAALETVREQPLKGAPGRVDLHGRFQTRIVGIADVGGAAADVRVEQTVLVTQSREEIARGRHIAGDVASVRE